MKYRIVKLEDVAEADRAKYEAAKDSKGFTLAGIEGAVDKATLDEFRENNIALKTAMEALTKKFENVNLEEYARVQEEQRKVKEKKLIESGKVEEIVTERVSAMEKAHKKVIDEMTTKLQATTGQLENLIIDQGITQAAATAGIRASAIPDVINRGKQLYKVVDGKAVPMEGDKIVYSEDGRTPMGYDGWFKNLTTSAPHLFEPSKGSGSGDHTKTPTGAKTIARAAYNAMSLQAQHDAVTKDKMVIVD